MALLADPLDELLTAAQLHTYTKGQVILHEGESPNDLFLIKEGIVKVHDIDDQGNDKILHILKQPAVFPLGSLLSTEKEVASFYTPVTDTEIYTIPAEHVSRQMGKDSRLATYMLRRFARETHELLVRISSMEKTTVYDRLVATLKFLAVHHAKVNKTGWRRVYFPVSHQLLADMTGVTRERMTQVIQELLQQRVIRYTRQTTLEINFARLVDL